MAFYLLTETGDKLLLEDLSGSLILEESPDECALLQETGDVILLEDGTSRLLLESCEAPPPEPPPAPAPPPPSFASGRGGSWVVEATRSTNDIVAQLKELKRQRELELRKKKIEEPVRDRRVQKQLMTLIPMFMETIEQWDRSAAA